MLERNKNILAIMGPAGAGIMWVADVTGFIAPSWLVLVVAVVCIPAFIISVVLFLRALVNSIKNNNIVNLFTFDYAKRHYKKLIALIIFVPVIIFSTIHFVNRYYSAPKYKNEQITLYDLFLNDYRSQLENKPKFMMTYTLELDTQTVFNACIIPLIDIEFNNMSFIYHIPFHSRTPDAVRVIIQTFQRIKELFDKEFITLDEATKKPQYKFNPSKLTASKTLYVYHEFPISYDSMLDLQNYAKEQGLKLIFRGHEYLAKKNKEDLKLTEHTNRYCMPDHEESIDSCLQLPNIYNECIDNEENQP